ncbi:hypothetical protein BGX31_010116 [Mortierella sp. GBA43]|nr:hypothetical protein BGX31_010116 [Mortierella sp. GBA43]
METAGVAMTSSNVPPPAPALAAATADTINGNIKEMKTRVLDFNRAKILFDAREKEILRLNQELSKAQKTIETLQSGSGSNSTPRQDYDELRVLLATRTRELEEARVDSRLAKLKQKDAEERLVKQSQKLKATEMLKSQLEAKSTDQEKLLGQLKDLQKKLDASSRRSKQEISDLREKWMSATAETANRNDWLQEQKKIWENDEERRSTQKSRELIDRVSELEHQIEDIRTEQYVENEMAKEQLKNATDRLEKTTKELGDAKNNIKLLNRRIMESQVINSDPRCELGHQHTSNLDNLDVTEEFEEVDMARSLVPSSNSAYSKLRSSSIHRSTDTTVTSLSNSQLEGALRAIEGIRDQLQIHRLVSDSHGKQRIITLSEKVRNLREEKQVLQDEITRLLVQGRLGYQQPGLNQANIPNIPTTQSVVRQDPDPSLQDEDQPVQNMPKRRGRPPKKIQAAQIATSTAGKPPSADVRPTTNPTSVGATSMRSTIRDEVAAESTTTDMHIDTTTPIPIVPAPAKRGRKRKADLEPATTPVLAMTGSTKRPRQTRLPLLKRTRLAKKTANAKSTEFDLSTIEIRNISDKLAVMKLNTVARMLPDQLDKFFEAVQVKAKEIAPGVAAFCKDNDITEDDFETYILQDCEPIKISTFLSPSEIYIVQVACVLHARFPEVSFGFSTLTDRCNWPAVENAPHIDILVEELMNVVRAPDFMETYQHHPRYAFALRKSLELLFVQGYDWSEFYVRFLRPELFKAIMDESRYVFFMPLVASVARDCRFRSKPSSIDNGALRTYLEAVLISKAKMGHQVEAALAIATMSDGHEGSLAKVKEWLHCMDEEQRRALPQHLLMVVE